jgi:hypothetical protein
MVLTPFMNRRRKTPQMTIIIPLRRSGKRGMISRKTQAKKSGRCYCIVSGSAILRCQSFKLPYQMIATLFKLSTSAVYQTIPKHENANDDLHLPDPASIEKLVPNLTNS